MELSTVANVADLRWELKHRQGRVAKSPGAKRPDGNETRRIRLRLTVPGCRPEDAKRLADVLAHRVHRPLVLGQDMGQLPLELATQPIPQFPQDAEERAARAEFDGQGTDNIPISDEDARRRLLREIVARQGQSDFRETLLRAYRRQCAVTGCTVTPVLEAAHLHPYRGPQTNLVTNGLLLRADVHTLLDLKLMVAPGPPGAVTRTRSA